MARTGEATRGDRVDAPLALDVLVTGMHRSGTSALAEALRASGLYAGEAHDAVRGGLGNPMGYGEQAPITRFDDRLLRALGWPWDAPPPLPATQPPACDDHVAEGRRLIATLFGDRRGWLIKDPRISLLLPWWRRILLDRFVTLVVRRPAHEVAWSLAVRDGFPPELGLALWAAYHRHLAAGLDGLPVIVVDYVALAEAPGAVLHSLFDALHDLGSSGGSDRDAAVRTIQPLLRRATMPRGATAQAWSAGWLSTIAGAWPDVPVQPYEAFSAPDTEPEGWEAALLDRQRRLRQCEAESRRARAAHAGPDQAEAPPGAAARSLRLARRASALGAVVARLPGRLAEARSSRARRHEDREDPAHAADVLEPLSPGHDGPTRPRAR